jgi:hypothetical protein
MNGAGNCAQKTRSCSAFRRSSAPKLPRRNGTPVRGLKEADKNLKAARTGLDGINAEITKALGILQLFADEENLLKETGTWKGKMPPCLI